MCAVRTFKGYRRTDGIRFIREDDTMITFLLGYFNTDIPVWQWVLVSLWEIFIELMILACWQVMPIAVQ